MANKQHAQFSDENGNLFYLENQTEDVLDPSGKPLSDGGDLSEASVKFSVDTSRKLPQSGGRFKAFLGSIVKYLTDLGAAAYLAVANNDTTTQPGFVGDARVLKQHRDAINQLNSDLKFPDGTGFYPDIKDGQQGYNTDPARGADTFHPFKNVEYLGEKQGSVSDGRYATFNISDYANYQGITVDNIFPTISYMMHSSNGDGAGTMSWSYNPEAGMLTFDNGDNSLVSIRAKIYVI